MAEATVSPPAPAKRRRWLRRLAWVLGTLVVLVLVVYFVATSSAFFKGVILPRVAKALNADLTASDASISPFRHVVLHNLRLQTTGAEPLLTVPEIRLRYHLMDILGGNIHVEEVTVNSPTIVLVENPDGTRNIDPLFKTQGPKAQPREKPPVAAKPAKPLQINLQRLSLTGATIRYVKLYQNGTRDVDELANLNLTVADVRNGQTGQLTLGADLSAQNYLPPGTNGLLRAKLSGSFAFALTPGLQPASVKGNTRLEIIRAEGALAQLASLGGDLDCDITPSEIKQVALRFQKGASALGQVRVSGPFDLQKTEGRLQLEIIGIDKQVLNLAGAFAGGLDFGTTVLSSTNQILLAKAASVVTAGGRFNVDHLQVLRGAQTTPTLDLHADYDVTVDLLQKTNLLRGLTITGTQQGQALLRAALTSPMSLAGGAASNAIGDSTLNLTLSGLNLADWKPLLGNAALAGVADSQLKLVSQQGGHLLSFDLNATLQNLTTAFGTNQINQASVTLQLNGKAANFTQLDLAQCKLQVSQQNEPLLNLASSGAYNAPNQNADLQLTLQATLARLARLMPQPNLSVSSGTVELKSHLTQKGASQSLTGSLSLADFTGQFGSNLFRRFSASADLEVGLTPQQVQIKKLAGKLAEGANPGGAFDLTGTYDRTNLSAQLTARLTDFNQNALGPFVQPMLADKQLVSVALNANAALRYNPQGDSAVQAALQVTNLVVNDPHKQFPATPLEARMQLEAGLAKKLLALRQCQFALTPTARGTNQLQLTGQIDLSDTNAVQGNLKLVADSLDLTTYYDLFVGQNRTAAGRLATNHSAGATARTAPATTAQAAPHPEKEPDALKLPIRNFSAVANVRRLYLGEVEIADWQTTTKIDGGRLLINPLKLALNGAPVSSTLDLDLGVPGFKYDFALNFQAIPLVPLINTFQPERKGILSGTLSAAAKANGAGTSGADLKKNLTGQFDLNSTNLNLAVDSIPADSIGGRLLKTVVGAIAVIPELARNPGSSAVSLVQGLTGRGGANVTGASPGGGGLSLDLKQSPINAIVLHGAAGAGQIDLRQALIQSPAFEASASGTVLLDDVLTNSTLQIPVSVSLERAVAQRINLAGSTPSNATYAKLPDFLTLKGTLGNPKSDINKLALAGAVLQGVGGKAGQAGGVLQNLGGILGTGGTNAPAGTNPPGGKLGGLLQGLGGTLGNPASATNQPATNQSPVGNLLNDLLGPRKK